MIGRDAGGYLTRLESDYSIVAKKQPMFAAASTKGARYCLTDNFFIFWFRFIFKYGYLLEIKGYDRLRKIILRDYETFSGFALERYFRELFIESGEWTRLGSWWDRKGENEIDLLAENEIEGVCAVCEVKREKARIDMDAVKAKYEAFTKSSGKWKRARPKFIALSMDDM